MIILINLNIQIEFLKEHNYVNTKCEMMDVCNILEYLIEPSTLRIPNTWDSPGCINKKMGDEV